MSVSFRKNSDRPLPPGPHGTPKRARCGRCGCEAMYASYPDDTPRGWKRYGEDRFVCPLCLERKR